MYDVYNQKIKDFPEINSLLIIPPIVRFDTPKGIIYTNEIYEDIAHFRGEGLLVYVGSKINQDSDKWKRAKYGLLLLPKSENCIFAVIDGNDMFLLNRS